MAAGVVFRGLAVATALIAAACSGNTEPSSDVGSPSSTAPPASLAPSPSIGPYLEGSKLVRFSTTDGVELEGRLFGHGPVGVVLAHGNEPSAQATWYPFVRVLLKHGYEVLTFDFRGFCPGGTEGCSEGTVDGQGFPLDVEAAVRYVRTQRVKEVFLIGASLGGHAAVDAASRPGLDLAGLIVLSTSQFVAPGGSGNFLSRSLLGRIQVPKLFIAGRTDPILNGRDAELMYRASEEPKRFRELPTSLHGASLLDPGAAPQAITAVLSFLAENH
jgi:pimeloyl-ACP methyl ester carboxylesterase